MKLVAHPDRGNFAAYEYDVNVDGMSFSRQSSGLRTLDEHDDHGRLDAATLIGNPART